MKSYNVLTWSIFGQPGVEDRIESAALFLINICKIKYKYIDRIESVVVFLINMCKIKYQNIYITTMFTFEKYMTWEVIKKTGRIFLFQYE